MILFDAGDIRRSEKGSMPCPAVQNVANPSSAESMALLPMIIQTYIALSSINFAARAVAYDSYTDLKT